MSRPPRRAAAGMALLVVVWGVNFPIVKGAFADLPPLAFNALRLSAAAALLAAAWRAEGRWWPSRADLPGLIVLGLIGHAAYQTLFIAGPVRTSAVHSSIILAMVPLLVGALGVLLRVERPTAGMWLGLAVAFAGVVVLVRGGAGTDVSGATVAGDLITFAAAACWAVYTVMAQPWLARMSALRVTTVTLVLSAPIVAAAGLPEVARLDWTAVGAFSWWALGFSTVFAIVISYVIWYRSVQLIGGTRTAALSNLIPIVTLAAAWGVLREPPRLAQAAGAAAVLCGVWLARRDRHP